MRKAPNAATTASANQAPPRSAAAYTVNASPQNPARPGSPSEASDAKPSSPASAGAAIRSPPSSDSSPVCVRSFTAPARKNSSGVMRP